MRKRGAILEIALAAFVLACCAWLGVITGWRGRPRTFLSTSFWPFYLDTWSPGPRWSWRVLLTLLCGGPVLLALRRWLRAPSLPSLALLAGSFWLFELACGIQRHGLMDGLSHTLLRWQEYWQDVRFVHPGFLARFPEVGRLSQHGATHPPGLTLLLAGLQSLGAHKPQVATVLCSLVTPLSIFPMWGATRRLVDDDTAKLAAPLLLAASSVTAFAVLAMDIVTMAAMTLALWGFACALVDGKRWGGVVFGVALAWCSLCNFAALVASIGFGVLVLARIETLDRRRWVSLLLAPAAFFAAYAVLVLGFGYRPLHVLQVCLDEFARSDNRHRPRLLSALSSPIAFLGALGVPLMGLVAHGLGSAVRRLAARPMRDRSEALLVLAGALPPAACIVLGKPRGEVEHIFLMFIPMLIVGAALAARRWFGRTDGWATWAVGLLLLQSVLIEVFLETFW